MHDPGALVVDIVAAVAEVDLARVTRVTGCDRLPVGEGPPLLLHLDAIGGGAALPLDVQRLHVGADSLVDPHVLPVPARDQVAPPLVTHFVVVQPVEVESWPAEAIAIRDDRLVLHAEERRLRDAVLLVAEGVRTACLLHVPEVVEKLGEGTSSAIGVPGQDPEAHG